MQKLVRLGVTRQIWKSWRNQLEKPALTFLELKHLAKHVNDRCIAANLDPREIDLFSLLDSSLNYYENLNFINQYLKQIGIGIEEVEELGTEKLREKYLQLKASYRRQKTRVEKLKKTNRRLRKRIKSLKTKSRKRESSNQQ